MSYCQMVKCQMTGCQIVKCQMSDCQMIKCQMTECQSAVQPFIRCEMWLVLYYDMDINFPEVSVEFLLFDQKLTIKAI